jgi:structural maintenance of chromosome 4
LTTSPSCFDILTNISLQKMASARSREIDITNQLEDITRVVEEIKGEKSVVDKRLIELKKKKKALWQDLDNPGEADKAREEMEKGDPSEEELEKYDVGELKKDIALLELELKNMKPNMGAIQLYRKKDREYQERVKEFDSVTERRDTERKVFEGLRKKRLDEFMAGFTTITMKLKEMYQMITLGGDAELELVDSLDPFSEGIVFSVRPPKKSWKNISNLSGGEKTLSSLALVFALHHYKPTPLYVMDEIDAALDFKNVSIVANYIKERTKNAQFIIISLRNNMFELADRLVGIYKTNDCTRSVAINPADFTIPTTTATAAAAATTSTPSTSSSFVGSGFPVSVR